jgi:hypothetical protein
MDESGCLNSINSLLVFIFVVLHMPIVHERDDDVDESKSPLLDPKQKSKLSAQRGSRNGFDYEEFIEKMKHPSCRPFLIQIRRFLSEFDGSFSASEQSPMFHRYANALTIK